MNYKITVTKESSKAWAWSIRRGRGAILAGGYCRTKRDALADAQSWIDSHAD